jgi:hypothetical protein
MTLRGVAVFALLLCMGGLGLAGSLAGAEIVEAVNAKLPEDEQFEPLGWYFAKTRRLAGTPIEDHTLAVDELRHEGIHLLASRHRVEVGTFRRLHDRRLSLFAKMVRVGQ